MATSSKRKTTYSYSEFTSYDSTVSALTTRWYTKLGVLDFAPINPEFIGKRPKKGDHVYDYESKVSVYLGVTFAKQLLKAITQVRAALESEESDIETITARAGEKSISFHLPGMKTLKTKGKVVDTSENIIIEAVVPGEDDDKIKVTHIMQNTVTEIVAKDGEVVELTEYLDLDLLEDFLLAVVQVALSGIEHATKNAGSGSTSGGSSSKKKSKFAAINDDDDDDFEEEEDDEDYTPKKKSSTRKPKVSTSDLEDEFDED